MWYRVYTYPMPSKQKLEEFYSEYFDLRAVDEVVTRNASRNLKFIQSKHEILQGGRVFWIMDAVKMHLLMFVGKKVL